MTRPTLSIRLLKGLRRLSWWTASFALNGLLLAVVLTVLATSKDAPDAPRTVSGTEEKPVPPLEEEVRPEVEDARLIEAREATVGDPLIKDARVSDHNETERDLAFAGALGQKDFASDAPFGGPSTNAAIGIGGGAAGAFAGRGGNRNFRAIGGASEESWRYAPPVDREGYDAAEEEGFRDPRRAPLSTFGIDVDTASYANVRRILTAGALPPAGAVRIEELVNYFDYDFPAPTDGRPFSVTTEVAECPWKPGHRLVMIGIQGRRIEERAVPPRNLVFLLDVSGSMRPSNKLPLLKTALRLLVERLRPEDRVGIVVYAGASGVVLEPTSGADRQRILGALSRLAAGGSTNGGAGIGLAYSLARKHFDPKAINRVILATDGDFNVGVTSRSELLRLIEKERESGIFLSVLGVGTGNLRDSQMEMLADRGNGNYAYLDSTREAEKVLVREADATLVTIAKDVKIQVEWNPQRVGAYRLIGYENRKLAARDFNDDRKDAGEIGAGHSVTALYEIAPPGDDAAGSVDPLRYQQPTVPAPEGLGDELLTVKLRYKEPDGKESRLIAFPVEDPGNVSLNATSRDFQFASAVAAFGMLLRGSEHRGQATFAFVREIAHAALGEDPEGDRREFLGLCDRVADLSAAAR